MNAKFLRNGIVMLVLVAGTVALLYTWVSSSAPKSSEDYSKFYNDVKAGAVQGVVQDGETLQVTTTSNAIYTVVVPNSITGDVYADMQKASAEGGHPDVVPGYEKKATADTSWIGLLLTGLLPLIVIGGFIFFMMRQAQGTNNQALSFGKSRARMFLGNKTVVT
ncbi:MAG TPA: ATP-dependent metallopeptidase FtsH/Yme1/Tma family protein, partial [Candidatus Limnocylindrales bacterium]